MPDQEEKRGKSRRADKKDADKEFDTCLESGPFAEWMQKMVSRQGVGSLCNFLRQLTLIYHYIHFRLDRPYLARRDRPDILKNLKEELEEGLANGGVPDGWLECLFLYGILSGKPLALRSLTLAADLFSRRQGRPSKRQ